MKRQDYTAKTRDMSRSRYAWCIPVLIITECYQWRLHIHNYTEYNQQWNVFSAFNPSKCTHTWSSGQLTVWRLGSSWCLAQGSHLSRGQFLPEPRFEPTTSNYKSDTLSTRATATDELHIHQQHYCPPLVKSQVYSLILFRFGFFYV